jgi:hypothetical protein
MSEQRAPIVRPPRMRVASATPKKKYTGPRTDRAVCRFFVMKKGCRNGQECEYKHTTNQCESCETYTEFPYCSRCYRKVRAQRLKERDEKQRQWEANRAFREKERAERNAKRNEEYAKRLKKDGKPCVWCKKPALGEYCRNCAQEANQYILRQCANCGSRMSAASGKYCYNCQ